MPDVSTGRVSRTERVFHGVVAGVLAAVFVASFFQVAFRRSGRSEDDPAGSICLLRRTTGLPCLTCGMTRSFYAMGRGAVGEALWRHPLGPLVFGLFAVLWVRSTGIFVTGRRWMDGVARFLARILPVVVLAAVVCWAGRLVWMFWSGAASAAWDASLLGRLFLGGG